MNSTTLPTVFAILASAVIVLGGLVALTRAIWKAAQDIRDNRVATVKNTTALADLSVQMDGRISALENRMALVEGNAARDGTQSR